jgi:hypothetical protein
VIIRRHKQAEYTTISNATLRDERLSWKARGILAYALSLPDDWVLRREHLAEQSPDGDRVVRTGLRELQEHGYLSRIRGQGPDGRITWFMDLYEDPADNPQPCGNQPVGSGDNPATIGPVPTHGLTSDNGTDAQVPSIGPLSTGGEPPPLLSTEEEKERSPIDHRKTVDNPTTTGPDLVRARLAEVTRSKAAPMRGVR